VHKDSLKYYEKISKITEVPLEKVIVIALYLAIPYLDKNKGKKKKSAQKKTTQDICKESK
jgi:hypothetical protein